MMLSNIGIHGGVSSEQLFNHTHQVTIAEATTAANTAGLVTGTSNGDDGNHTHTIASHTHTIASTTPTSAVGVAANYTNLPLYDIGENPVVDAYITMGGRERFEKRKGRYFNLIQPMDAHTQMSHQQVLMYIVFH